MNKNKLSPVMQQYVDIKAENPDAILMFRLGDFYEVFFEDAKIASNILGLALTHRGVDTNGDDIAMCGIPWHAADNYFGRLVRAGRSVALVEQMETPDQAKSAGRKFIHRAVVRVLTPGTLTDDNLLCPKKSNFLVAIIKKPDASFDIAGADISTGEFFIGTSSVIFDDLARISPAEIIYPDFIAEDLDIIKIRDAFKTTPVYEKLYNRSDIEQIIQRVFGGAHDSRGSGAIELLAAYLFNTLRAANITFRAPYNLGEGRQLLIDCTTWKSLEIDKSINSNGMCLCDILDKTKTAAGARRLAKYLRTLSADKNQIQMRQEHIGHLIINSDLMGALSQTLVRIPDVGRALSRLLSGRGMPRDLKNIADFLINLFSVKNLGLRLDASLAAQFAKINIHDELALELKLALSDDLPTFFRDGGVVRSGFHAGLDAVRDLASGARGAIAKLQAGYVIDTGVSTLKIKYNNVLGYFIEVPAARADNLMRSDSGFIHRQTMSGNMRFTTEQLINLDNEVRSAATRTMGIEAEIITELIEKIRDISDDLLCTAELIADTDVWFSLATVALQYSWVRPNMTDSDEFNIIGGRHPVIESALAAQMDVFVKNDCDLNDRKIALLTGPNMAGKSTYLRQNAILIVLSHLGSFVPAASATIGICDQLFSRVGASDNLAAGQSTFMVEMSETANILNRATPRSFIIFDEIGRGTATYDGMAIATAVLEFLNKMGARTLFATHYHELTKLKFDMVQCLTIDVREHNNEIVFMHKIIPGTADKSYGIFVAKMAGMPKSVIARATAVLDGLENNTDLVSYNPIVATISESPAKNQVSESAQKSQLSLFG